MFTRSHSPQAIDAYIQALELKPNYVRALANLGIAYSNQEHFAEAATCYLKALSLNPEVSHCVASRYVRLQQYELQRSVLFEILG